MSGMWQNSMMYFDPVAFSIGSFYIYWYALFFLLAWWCSYQTLLYFEKKEDTKKQISRERLEEISWILLLGVFVGARLGYVFFYAPEYFLEHMSQIFLPYDFARSEWASLRGMSFHGGVIGAVVATLYCAQKYKVRVLALGDRLVLVAPIASFFGRFGNFLNQELAGKVTNQPWGVYFPNEVVLRHPVTLYSAFFEGVVLFGWLVLWKKYLKREGDLTILYFISYGCIRLGLEYFREPDFGVGLFLDTFSRGQVLSIILIISAFVLWFIRPKYASIEST
jgi:phosphatidylglycerol---prolipoprotein diacylglyceryl transferase